MPPTFLWHDYETWGTDPRVDRACQFAAWRTDLDLQPVAEPVVVFCQPPLDLLPHPEACLVTGITPQIAERKGERESRFAERILAEFSVPNTCGAGYNSLRFDDEVTRFLFFRNLIDPYAREWRDGNSRWDLIDSLRAAHALRPEGLAWPLREDGTASFRLEDLAPANGIDHRGAHDALADVRATIALARLLKRAQPRLFDYALGLRAKATVRGLLQRDQPLLHVSARYPAALGCLAPVGVVAPHPTNANGFICFDLRQDPQELLDLSVETLRERLFTPTEQLPPGVSRPPLKTVQVNRVPWLAPFATLNGDAAARWRIDPDAVRRHARRLSELTPECRARVQAAMAPRPPATTDPEQSLYHGGFLSDRDRATLDTLRQSPPEALATAHPVFEDPRLPTLWFRFRARNWPRTLSPDEREEWEDYRLWRLTDPAAGVSLQIEDYMESIARLSQSSADDGRAVAILEALSEWGERVMDTQFSD